MQITCKNDDYTGDVTVDQGPEGDYVLWECPGCGAINKIDGNDPVERALAAANEPTPGAGEAGIEVITDGDDGNGGDVEP